MESNSVALRLLPRDQDLIERVAAASGMNRSQVLRRGILLQAAQLGLASAETVAEYVYRPGRAPRPKAQH